MSYNKLKERNLAAALYLSGLGFYILPCKGEGENYKEPATNLSGPWSKNSTRDEQKIREWWAKSSTKEGPLPAIDCKKSNILVLDGDYTDEENGADNLDHIFSANNIDIYDGSFFVVRTPRGGIHIYFKNNIEFYSNSTGNLPPKIDVRGAGYVLAPGASLINNLKYQPINWMAISGGIDSLPNVPDYIYGLLTSSKCKTNPINNNNNSLILSTKKLIIQKTPTFDKNNLIIMNSSALNAIPPQSEERTAAYAAAALRNAKDELQQSQKGNRNNTLLKTACSLWRMINSGWINRNEINELKNIALQIGLEPSAISSTVASACRLVGSDMAILPDDKIDQIYTQSSSLSTRSNIIQTSPMLSKKIIPEYNTDLYTPSIHFQMVLDYWLKDEIWQTFPEGLVGDICNYIQLISKVEQPQLALGAALALGSLIVGRGVELFNGSGFPPSNSLYIMNLSATGSGKNAPQEVVQYFAKKTQLSQAMFKGFDGTVEFLNESLRSKPMQIIVADEIGDKIAKSRKSSTSEAFVFHTYKEIWTSPIYHTPAGTLKNIGKAMNIEHPYIVILGSATVAQVFDTLTTQDVMDGTLNRWLVFRGDDTAIPKRAQKALKEMQDKKIPGFHDYDPMTDSKQNHKKNDEQIRNALMREKLVTQINHACEILAFSGRVQNNYFKTATVEMTEQASIVFDLFAGHLSNISKYDTPEREFVSRTTEIATRIATILAVLHKGLDKKIRQDHFLITPIEAWRGINYALKSSCVVMDLSYRHNNENQIEKDAKELLSELKRIFAEMETDNITLSDFYTKTKKKLKYKQSYKLELLDMLHDYKYIILEKIPSNVPGRPITRIFYNGLNS